ncbi:MAG: ABC transporter ATP-binding protein [Patescibacteria group bacterium]|nr:ABC transporter ATP-binding protein [Patescibacteria group bacterium]
MSDDIAIKIEGISKTFKLPHEKAGSIKNTLIGFARRKRGYELQEVLKDVTFDIKKGEFFGIVGRNGSGKSTLLKLISGIYTPSNGSITVNGKLTPFIELGVGFNHELTGRENVYLNGALLGFSRSEMELLYDDIVAFAELERFMDQKLKNYSSGMQVRLAFSIAIRVKTDILILDEVLAVGDESFQRKCLDVFEEYKRNKKTIVLVTHDMATVRRFCTKAVLIHDGKLISEGKTEEVTEGYTKLNQESIDNQVPQIQDHEPSDLVIALKNTENKNTKRFEYGEDLRVELSWPKTKKVNAAGVTINTSMGECAYATNTFIDKQNVTTNKIICSFKLNLGAGKYYIMAGTFLDRPESQVDFVTHGPSFFINQESRIKGEGITRLDHEWRQS